MATRKDLQQYIQKQYPELIAEDLNDIIDIMFDYITEQLVKNNRIEIRGFGTLSIRQRKARQARDPRNNQVINIAARKSIYYRMAKAVLEKLNPELNQ